MESEYLQQTNHLGDLIYLYFGIDYEPNMLH